MQVIVDEIDHGSFKIDVDPAATWASVYDHISKATGYVEFKFSCASGYFKPERADTMAYAMRRLPVKDILQLRIIKAVRTVTDGLRETSVQKRAAAELAMNEFTSAADKLHSEFELLQTLGRQLLTLALDDHLEAGVFEAARIRYITQNVVKVAAQAACDRAVEVRTAAVAAGKAAIDAFTASAGAKREFGSY